MAGILNKILTVYLSVKFFVVVLWFIETTVWRHRQHCRREQIERHRARAKGSKGSIDKGKKDKEDTGADSGGVQHTGPHGPHTGHDDGTEGATSHPGTSHATPPTKPLVGKDGKPIKEGEDLERGKSTTALGTLPSAKGYLDDEDKTEKKQLELELKELEEEERKLSKEDKLERKRRKKEEKEERKRLAKAARGGKRIYVVEI